MKTTWVQMKALRSPSLGAPSHVVEILEAENRQKSTDQNLYISVSTNIDKKSLGF